MGEVWTGVEAEPLLDHRTFRKIDVHAHLFSRGPEPSEEEMATLVRLARRANIERVVLLGNVVMGWPDYRDPAPEAVSAINTHTMVALARYPEIFLGFCYLSPAHPRSFIEEEVQRCIVEGGMRGIKLWVSVKATDERVEPIMERARALGIPVLHHSWYNQGPPTGNESTPAEVAQLAERFPHVIVIMAHLGGGGCRGVLDVAELPNVRVDTAGSQPEAGLVEYAVRRLGAERVLFGSDWPVRDIAVQVGRVMGAPLSAEQRALIFSGNSSRLLGLEEATA
jgi:hypothetical protein